MAYGEGGTGERWRPAALTVLAVVALGAALLSGFDVTLPVGSRDVSRLLAFEMPPPPKPPAEKPPPPRRRPAEREGASAPPNLRSRATPVEVPPPLLPPIQPPPVTVAPVAATGIDASSGAALVAGPGTGAGGVGTGTGNGARGTGRGAGGTPARVVSRPLRLGELPQALVRALLTGDARYDVEARYTVTPQGRVTDCVVTRSSGNPALDAATCQAMVAKLRYRPERDAAGHPVAVETEGFQTWESHDSYAPDD